MVSMAIPKCASRLALLGAFFWQSHVAFGACTIKRAEIPVTMAGTQPLVTARIEDQEVHLLLDSGAFYSTLSSAGARQLNLTVQTGPEGLSMAGIGGTARPFVTRVRSFTLQNTVFKNWQFLVQDNELGSGTVGVLGQDLLGSADAEYDLGTGSMRIVNPGDACGQSSMAYWAGAQPVSELKIIRRQGNGPVEDTITTASVNGIKMRVQFDSGAERSLMTLDAAARAGLTPAGKGVIPGEQYGGFGPHQRRTWIAPVDEFEIGGEKLTNTRLRFGDFQMGDVDMLIGADFFLSHRIYVANRQNKLYFTYSGGPIFNLSTTPVLLSQAGSGHEATSTEPERFPDLTDADAYARRGAALEARQNLKQALVDFNRACELAPGVGQYFRQRGMIHAELGHYSIALADLDQAVSLRPSDLDALVFRARLHHAGSDTAGAQRDLDAADRVAAAQADLRREMGDLYLQLDLLDAAISQFDRWIAAHDGEARIPAVLSDRCWARALKGAELEKALQDCNIALIGDYKSATRLSRRGTVHVRRGDLSNALSDYETALKIDPKDAWSLYGRGIVRRRQGAVEAGDSDIAAAIAVLPSIGDDAVRHGLKE